MRRWWPGVVVVTGCVWIDTEEEKRGDNDGDGWPFALDCNDERDDVGAFSEAEVAAELACGDRIEAVLGARDLLGFAQCMHPTLLDDLVVMSEAEALYAFRADAPTDVALTLDTTSLELTPSALGDNGDVPLIANRGAVCSVDRCETALPPAPAAWLESARDLRPPWTPTLHLRAEPGDLWYVVVSGAPGSTYGLSVDCGG